MTMRLIDANVIIRFLANDDPKQSKASRALFERLEDGSEHVELLLPVLFEVVYVLQGVYRQPRNEIAQVLSAIIQLSTVHVQGKQMTLRMLEYWSAKKLDLTDCYLVAMLESSKRSELYSFDRDFDKFKFVSRIEPRVGARH